MRQRLFITLALLCALFTLRAQEPLRPECSEFSAEWGASSLTDTYLSPLRYSGWHAGVDYNHWRAASFAPEAFTLRGHVNAGYDHTLSPAGNSVMQAAMVSSDINLLRRFRAAPGLTLAVGAGAELRGGALYNARNGNNPVSARAMASLNLSAYASYSFTLWRVPVTLRYIPTLPVTGAFFCPQYGELYYEIYQGNRSNLVHGAWWGNHFRFSQSLAAHFRLGASSVSVGYRGEYSSQKANSLIANSSLHCLTLGVSTDLIRFNPRKGLPSNAVTVNPIDL